MGRTEAPVAAAVAPTLRRRRCLRRPAAAAARARRAAGATARGTHARRASPRPRVGRAAVGLRAGLAGPLRPAAAGAGPAQPPPPPPPRGLAGAMRVRPHLASCHRASAGTACVPLCWDADAGQPTGGRGRREVGVTPPPCPLPSPTPLLVERTLGAGTAAPPRVCGGRHKEGGASGAQRPAEARPREPRLHTPRHRSSPATGGRATDTAITTRLKKKKKAKRTARASPSEKTRSSLKASPRLPQRLHPPVRGGDKRHVPLPVV